MELSNSHRVECFSTSFPHRGKFMVLYFTFIVQIELGLLSQSLLVIKQLQSSDQGRSFLIEILKRLSLYKHRRAVSYDM